MLASRTTYLDRNENFGTLPMRVGGYGLLIFRPEPRADSFLDVGGSLLLVLSLGHTTRQSRAFDNNPAVVSLVERHVKDHADILPIAIDCHNAGGFAIIRQ